MQGRVGLVGWLHTCQKQFHIAILTGPTQVNFVHAPNDANYYMPRRQAGAIQPTGKLFVLKAPLNTKPSEIPSAAELFQLLRLQSEAVCRKPLRSSSFLALFRKSLNTELFTRSYTNMIN